MADLPDIDTANTSYIAYWNAIDQGGVSSIDPSEALNDGGIIEYTLYDNGWDGTYNYTGYSYGVDQQINVRVKNDGWVIAYMDLSSELDTFQRNTRDASAFDGVYNLADNWEHPGNNSSIQSNILARAINNLRGQFSNSGSMAFNYSDVGLYEFEWGGAATTLFSHQEQIGDGSSGGTIDARPGFIRTSGTAILYGVAMGSGRRVYDYGGGKRIAEWDGIELLNDTSQDKEMWGNLEIVDNGHIPAEGQEKNGRCYVETSNYRSEANLSVFTVWE